MLLRIVPVIAVVLTLVVLLGSPLLQPHQKDGLSSPAHAATGLF